MKRIMTFLALLCAFFIAKADRLTLNDLTGGAYSARDISGVTPLLDGESYSQLSPDHKQIIQHSFRTGEETGVLFDVNNIKNRVKIDHIDGYTMSPDEKNILVQTETKGIYRYSRTAEYYIYNIKNRTLAHLSEGGPQEQPLWSRDGTMVAFVRDGNLFLVKLLFNNSESQITKDGEFNKIINGKPDWVNEEEFSFARAFDFNADNTMIAWIRYDESEVPMFSFPWYKGLSPEKKDYADYPGSYDYKYPIAGVRNSVVYPASSSPRTMPRSSSSLPSTAIRTNSTSIWSIPGVQNVVSSFVNKPSAISLKMPSRLSRLHPTALC